MMLYLVLSNLIFIIYALIEGFREGFYWHFKNTSKNKCEFEIHPIFSAQRGIVLLILMVLILVLFNPLLAILNLVSNMLIFSYFHNGAMYITRNKLDEFVYPLGWRDQSTTSTAKMTSIFTYRNRTICAIVGIVITIISILL